MRPSQLTLQDLAKYVTIGKKTLSREAWEPKHIADLVYLINKMIRVTAAPKTKKEVQEMINELGAHYSNYLKQPY